MDTQKITAHLPVELLRRAQEMTGQGITETLRRGLEELTTAEAYRRLRLLRGQAKLTIDVDAVRRDKPRRAIKRRPRK